MLSLSFKRTFFWVPKATHYVVVLSPLVIVYALHGLFGEEIAAVSVAGAAFFLYKTVLYPRDMERNSLSSRLLTRPGTKKNGKRVAVIGAGPAGLVTAKECIEGGHEVVTYDYSKSVGGEFGNRFWPGGKLTSSPYVTCFSDFEPKKRADGTEIWLHMTKEEYVTYLEEYADHYKVTPSLLMQTAVTKVATKTLPGEELTFNLTVETWKDGKKETRVDGPFDHVAFCIGGNREPFIPKIPGIEGFKNAGGEVYHSADFGDAKSIEEAFNWADGKRVVGVGMGESMADLYGLMLNGHPHPPKECYIAIRSGAWIIPRVNPLNGLVNDWDSTRIRYAMPKWAHNYAVRFCAFLSDYFSLSECEERSIRYKLLSAIPGVRPCYKCATKSNDFVHMIAQNKAKLLLAGITKLEGKTIYFSDGTIVEDVDSIIFGTGFKKFNPFSKAITFKGKASPNICPCGRFLRIFDPCFGDKVGFIGIGIRPLIGSIPTIAEIQARLFAAVVSGERVLPPTDVMIARAMSDSDLAFKEFGRDNANALSSSSGWSCVVNWIPYMDTIAREVGCTPTNSWILSKPLFALKLLYGPMSVMHYRLCGPGAKTEMAESVINRLPIGARMIDMVFYTSIHMSLALFMWPSLFLNPSMYAVIFDTQKFAIPKIRAYMKKTMSYEQTNCAR